MGCDIHSYVEVRVDGKWEVSDKEVFPLEEWNQKHYQKTHNSIPFNWRSYGMFAFLADVRNYAMVPPIGPTRRGIPDDSPYSLKALEAARAKRAEEWQGDTGLVFGYSGFDDDDDCGSPYSMDNHSHSWVGLRELIEFDYDQMFENRRNNGNTVPEGQGTWTTYRAFLGPNFFRNLEALKTLGALDDVRVIFWFDN